MPGSTAPPVDRLPTGAIKRYKFGFHPALPGSWETIWNTTGAYPWATWPDWDDATGVAVTISTPLAGDEGAVYTYEILGPNGVLTFNTVTLHAVDSSTPVTLPDNATRLMRAQRQSAGAATQDVLFRVGAVTVATIDKDLSSTELALYTVPAGYELLLQWWKTSVDRGNDARFQMLNRQPGQAFVSFTGAIPSSGTAEDDFTLAGGSWRDAPSFPAGTDIDIQGQEHTGPTVPLAAARFFFILLPV